MTLDLEALALQPYVFADEYPVAARTDRRPLTSDSELVALAACQAGGWDQLRPAVPLRPVRVRPPRRSSESWCLRVSKVNSISWRMLPREPKRRGSSLRSGRSRLPPSGRVARTRRRRSPCRQSLPGWARGRARAARSQPRTRAPHPHRRQTRPQAGARLAATHDQERLRQPERSNHHLRKHPPGSPPESPNRILALTLGILLNTLSRSSGRAADAFVRRTPRPSSLDLTVRGLPL